MTNPIHRKLTFTVSSTLMAGALLTGCPSGNGQKTVNPAPEKPVEVGSEKTGEAKPETKPETTLDRAREEKRINTLPRKENAPKERPKAPKDPN